MAEVKKKTPTKAAKSETPTKKPRASRKKKVEPMGLTAAEVAAAETSDALSELSDKVTSAGGQVLATYREPYGGHHVMLCALPTDQVEPTPFQRQLSDTHAKRLTGVIPKVERFLDPLIAVAAPTGGFWTPNGMHRLEAMKRLGARTVMVLLIPEFDIAYRILALNTEKAHNLKDKSLEVVRMADAIADRDDLGDQPENTWAFEFEEPAFLTIGRCYEERARFSGGAYAAVFKKCDDFLDVPIRDANETRKERATRVLAVDDIVIQRVAELKEAGLQSTYLKPFVVARINPLRFSKSKSKADFDETLDKMMAKIEAFDATKIKPQDLAKTAPVSGD